MYTTPERVHRMTGYTVSTEVVERAQFIIEAVTGRLEAEIDDPTDLEILANATSFQAAYMSSNFEKVYEQVALISKTATDSEIIVNSAMDAPYLAPLAVIAMRRLSWTRSRSVQVGGTFGRYVMPRWEMD